MRGFGAPPARIRHRLQALQPSSRRPKGSVPESAGSGEEAQAPYSGGRYATVGRRRHARAPPKAREAAQHSRTRPAGDPSRRARGSRSSLPVACIPNPVASRSKDSGADALCLAGAPDAAAGDRARRDGRTAGARASRRLRLGGDRRLDVTSGRLFPQSEPG